MEHRKLEECQREIQGSLVGHQELFLLECDAPMKV